MVNGEPLEGQFSNTLLIPELSTTLISIRNLTGNHHQVVFKDNWAEVVVKFTGKLVAKAVLGHGGIYIIQTHQLPKYSAHSAKSKSIDINVLHHRLGHLGFDNVHKLVSGNMIKDIQLLTGEPEFCNACAQGKAHRLPLPSGPRTSAPGLLDIIHSDIVGPLPTSIGGMTYFTMFINDHS